MRIIAGCARNLELTAPPTMAVRPTAVRSRKALFDSLGGFSGLRIVDLFAGSGALGLEAASRGAVSVVFIEREAAQLRCIEANVARVRRTGAEFEARVLSGDAGCPATAVQGAPTDVVFADPPYADSASHFAALLKAGEFRAAFAGVRLVWELPDTPGAVGEFLDPAETFLPGYRLREFGGVTFLLGRVDK